MQRRLNVDNIDCLQISEEFSCRIITLSMSLCSRTKDTRRLQKRERLLAHIGKNLPTLRAVKDAMKVFKSYQDRHHWRDFHI